MIFILDMEDGELLESEIVLAETKSIPLKKDGWSFNWRQLSKDGRVYVLRTFNTSGQVQGALCLKVVQEMLVMEALELAPHNVGRKTKRYDDVAGCLIAFACRESFKIKGDYKGFVTFVSKTNLIAWYSEKYGATQALGQRMFIDWENGEKLIELYLYRNKADLS